MSVAGRVVVALAVATLALSATSASVAVQDGPVGQAGIDADSTTLAAAVGPDGSADWRVTYRFELDGQNATDAFESLRQDIEANRSRYVATFRERIEATAASAENATGREMAVGNFSVEAETRAQPDTTFGVVTYRFEWAGFAAVDGDRVVLSEPFASNFQPDREFRVVLPNGDELVSATPEPADTGGGEVAYATGASLDGFELVAGEPGSDDGGSGDGGESDDSDGGDDDSDGATTPGAGSPGFGVLAVVLALAAALVGFRVR